ncbi:MAG: hypothetical protein PHY73_01705 [Candidatus Omnitrophica bacterium]|nr:hypothetical protein [Candidatus Omnitrophota bacterium]
MILIEGRVCVLLAMDRSIFTDLRLSSFYEISQAPELIGILKLAWRQVWDPQIF